MTGAQGQEACISYVGDMATSDSERATQLVIYRHHFRCCKQVLALAGTVKKLTGAGAAAQMHTRTHAGTSGVGLWDRPGQLWCS
jgi:hypothetical protein